MLAEKGSARAGTVVVPSHDSSKLKMSSLVLVARTEGTPELPKAEGEKAPPFYYGDTLLYPNVGEPLKGGIDRYSRSISSCTRRPGAVRAPPKSLCFGMVTSLRDTTRQLETGNSRFQHVGQLPIETLPAGVVRVACHGGRQLRPADAHRVLHCHLIPRFTCVVMWGRPSGLLASTDLQG